MADLLFSRLSELIQPVFPILINILFALYLDQSDLIPLVYLHLQLFLALLSYKFLVLFSLPLNLFEE